MLTKQETIGKVHQGREPRRTVESCGLWLTVLGFMVMGLVSGLSLANHSDSESFLVVYTLLSQDGTSKKDSGRWLDMCYFLLTFPELLWLVVACSTFLTRTSCHKITQGNSYCDSRVGSFSHCGSPNKVIR